ncbi:PREDICTED: probable LRR receptor-like serine/threonine-protein kinase At3g47570-like [Fragaria vesca subsp. vesca]
MAAAQTNISTDQSALLALKAHITSDPHNLIFTNWSTTTSVCNWFGVTCGARHLRATALNLSYFDLEGTIPPQLGNLSFLVYINLKNNSFHGSLPKELARFIPAAIFNLSALQVIDLRYNQLSGSIPREMGNLTTLKEIYLDNNNFIANNLTGSLSEDVGKLKAVIVIDLSDNYLYGRILSSIGNLQTLQNLCLEDNNLEGRIPSSLGKSLSLVLLDLSKNNLSGVITKSLESLKYLKILDLSFNKLQGEIPTSGPFRNFSAQSFVSSGELCGAPRFHVPACKNITLEAHSTGRSILKYIILGILSAMFIVSSIWIVILRRRKNVEAAKETALLPQLLWRRVSHLELVRATNAFDERNLLGTGGFGLVYKGTFSDGVDVAIKVFNLQLEGAFKSFDIECEMLSNIRHRNLIKIISCCSQLDFKAVVLNYMPNESLEKWLHSQNLCLNIMQRLSIMIDVASALEYLHHGYGTPIVHCDMKPSNILLDEDMTAHVTDFGIAKLLCGRDSMTQTITQATIGYMAPEYGTEGIVTRRGDVYSFGIVLMETFTGKKPTDEMFVAEMSLKQWVANSVLLDVVDAKLQVTEADDRDFVNKSECLSSVMRLALACSAESPEERVNMQDALVTLNKIKIKFFKDATRGVVLNRSLV